MTDFKVSTRTLVAVLVATTAALVIRSWLQVELLADGWDRKFSADISYLVVPPVLALLLFPLWRSHKSFLASHFERKALSGSLILRAVAIGFLLRLIAWGEMLAGVSFGWYRSDNPQAIVGPDFSFQCGSPATVFLGFAVMALLVPIIEEIFHRGIVVSYFRRRGPFLAIFISALIFMVFHTLSSWPIVFLAGMVFAIQYWFSNSLWPSLFTHATVNGLIQIDWYCLNTIWNPTAAELPVLTVGIASSCVALLGLAGIAFLLRQQCRGTRNGAPRSQSLTKRWLRAQ